ncbi:MAG TPA: Gfo/Idh/MocA family oxidoreductase [Phototrophicaceae bacterium]|nr:Gfo/Idh/MocA family oxidoreductase [Phototrophicaceae bacterium]
MVQTPQPLRVGIVGVGGIGETHIKAYRQIPGVEIVAVADPAEARLAQIASNYAIPNKYTDHLELIARDDIEAISVCTPNHLHMPVTVAALEAGKHVLCEKPLARSSAEGEAMVRAATAAGRVLQVAFNHRQRGDVQVLKQYVGSGGLGRIYHGKAFWMRRAGIPGMGGWFTNREQAGGGPLIDLGVHVLDMALFLLGEPEVISVSAATYAELGPRGRGHGNWGDGKLVGAGGYEVEDLATAFVRLGDGSTLLLEASWAVYGKNADDFGVTLYGTEGGADIHVKNYGFEDTLTIYTDTAGVPSEVRPKVRRGEGHVAVIRNFITAINGGDWSTHNGREGLKRAQIIDACYQSALQGREIPLIEITSEKKES